MRKNSAAKIAKELILANPQNKTELEAFKRAVAKKHKIPYPSNLDLMAGIASLQQSDRRKINHLFDLLRTRPIRSLSGIVNVSVLTKPYPCPGNCLYCPAEDGFPKSYLSGEPAAERAHRLKFNPWRQTFQRLKTLADEGHIVDKIELRIIGGTWSYYPKTYQQKFIAACFAAANDFGAKKCKRHRYSTPVKRLALTNNNILQVLQTEQKKNETAKCRIIGISVETRPDYITPEEIIYLRQLGVTRVELGVQSIFDDVLDLNRRGHKVCHTICATKLLKDAAFKVSYQIMLNLLGSTAERDLQMAKELFSNSDFCPDLLKIYPLAVLKEAPLYELYQQGKFQPYSINQLVELIKAIKKIVPPWVRIERIIRDIPAGRIIGSANVSNLRQLIAYDMQIQNWQCQCIRCREVKNNYNPQEKLILTRRDYLASGGKEIFLSFENKAKTKLYSLLRLRLPGKEKEAVLPVLKNAALIREIHTYGQQTAINKKAIAVQHRGLGKKLIKEAERIIKQETKFKKIASIAGIGARDYWRKFGYKLQNTYLVKKIAE